VVALDPTLASEIRKTRPAVVTPHSIPARRASPCAAAPRELGDQIRSIDIRNLTVREIGPGAHFAQEDHPAEIGDAVKEWRRRSVLGQA
jgi:mRNA-degrading endonuclease toxin of MazEF toxin-antitoxin module